MDLVKKRRLSYLFAILIFGPLISGFTQVIIYFSKLIFKKELDFEYTSLIVMAVLGFIYSVNLLARYIRSSVSHLPLFGLFNLPNFLYDKQFEDEYFLVDKKILKENEELKAEIEKLKTLIKEQVEELSNKDHELQFEAYINDIYIRHHKNASRLVRSLLQLMAENKPHWKWEFCNNVLDECITVLQKDRADKSAAIFFINENNELVMFAYNRIEFWSTRNRRFKYNEGFAGHVWSYGQKILINDVSKSSLFMGEFEPKHEYGSILGVPIKIGDEVVGVLCIQSEKKDGFTQEDEHSIKFYADMCALAHYCDKMSIGRNLNEDSRVRV